MTKRRMFRVEVPRWGVLEVESWPKGGTARHVGVAHGVVQVWVEAQSVPAGQVRKVLKLVRTGFDEVCVEARYLGTAVSSGTAMGDVVGHVYDVTGTPEDPDVRKPGEARKVKPTHLDRSSGRARGLG